MNQDIDVLFGRATAREVSYRYENLRADGVRFAVVAGPSAELHGDKERFSASRRNRWFLSSE